MSLFEREYFVDSKFSNYVDYRKKKFDGLAKDLSSTMCRLSGKKTVSLKVRDFGCATGGVVFALKKIGVVDIKGTDISYWAVEWGREHYHLDREELQHYNEGLLREKGIDFVLFLDVLEHIPFFEEYSLFEILEESKPIYIIFRVPVSEEEGKDFVLDVSKNDKTHIECHSKNWWNTFFKNFGFIEHERLNESTIYDSDGVYCGVLINKRCSV